MALGVAVGVHVDVEVGVRVAVDDGVQEGVDVAVKEGVNDAVAVGGTHPNGRQAGWVPVLGSGAVELVHSATNVPL